MHAVSPGLTGTFVVGQWVPGSPPRFASRIGFNALLAVGQRSNTVLDAPLDIQENARVSQVATTADRAVASVPVNLPEVPDRLIIHDRSW